VSAVEELFRLDGRSAVVTGASSGLGAHFAVVLARAGADVAVAARRRDMLDAVAAAVRAEGRRCVAVPTDVTDPAQCTDLVDAAVDELGAVHVLVNNAGISLLEPAETTTVQQWRRVLDVNLTGPFLLCQRFGKQMLDNGAGAIVNIASIAGLHAVADRSAYNASKHGLVGLTKTLAAEWGGRGVRVNAVCPGWVKTEMDAADQASGGYTDQDVTDRVPMGRFATPEDIAAAVAFLADPARSGFVNGAQLPVDGGWIADASWTSLRLRKR
jgi:NAD(P)-dependent dehydrogenase (short-subunit alcohol dehydrogenase family)